MQLRVDREPFAVAHVAGIGGLEEHVLKSATVSSTVACPAFTSMYFYAAPILRVAVEPVTPGRTIVPATGLSVHLLR